MGAGALGCIPHPHSKSLSFSCFPKCLLAEFCMDLASPCAIPAAFARPNSQRRPGESRPLPRPGKNRHSRDGKHKGKSLRSRIPATQKVLHRTSPGISLPKAKAWLARGASEPPPSSAPPRRLSGGNLIHSPLAPSLWCALKHEITKIYRKKKNPAVASQLHTGASPAAPWNCPLPPSLSSQRPAAIPTPARAGLSLKTGIGTCCGAVQSVWSIQDGILGCREAPQLHLLPKQGRGMKLFHRKVSLRASLSLGLRRRESRRKSFPVGVDGLLPL